MLDRRQPDKSAIGNKSCDPASDPNNRKSNVQLLDEIEELLNVSAEEMDTDRIEAYLSILQERAPVTEHYDPAAQWTKLEAEHPLIFEEEPSPCEAYPAAAEPPAKHHHTGKGLHHFLRAAGISVAAVFCFVVTASAMGFPPAQAVLHWAEGIIQVYTNPSGLMELPDDDPSEYHSLEEALEANGINAGGLPTWVPRDYSILSATAKSSDGVTKCSAVYESDRGSLVIRVMQSASTDIAVIEERDANAVLYQHNSIDFFIVSDGQWMKAGWQDNPVFFSISGQISEDEIKEMIDSIQSQG